MERFSFNWTRLAAALLAGTLAFHVWRAANTSITADEAFTANSFVAPPWLTILTTYDANHHVLHSLLCKISVGVFGWSEFALRLPALLGTALFFWCLLRLVRNMVGDSPLLPAVCMFIVWWPEMSEYLSIARGYSLALGLFTAAIALVQTERWRLVSLLLGLSIAANLVFAIPAVALGLALLIRHQLWPRFDELAAPGAVAACILLAIPLSRVGPLSFYVGEQTIAGSLHTLLRMPGPKILAQSVLLLAPLLAVAGAWRERGVLALSTGFSLAGLAVLHFVLKRPLPYGRTGLYLILLTLLLVAALTRGARWPALFFGACALWCIVNIDPWRYLEWTFDADNRQVMTVLHERYPRARVAGHFPLAHMLSFYKRAWNLDEMPGPVECQPGVEADVYVLRTDETLPRPPGLRVIRRFQRSGLELAIP